MVAVIVQRKLRTKRIHRRLDELANGRRAGAL